MPAGDHQEDIHTTMLRAMMESTMLRMTASLHDAPGSLRELQSVKISERKLFSRLEGRGSLQQMVEPIPRILSLVRRMVKRSRNSCGEHTGPISSPGWTPETLVHWMEGLPVSMALILISTDSILTSSLSQQTTARDTLLASTNSESSCFKTIHPRSI